VLCASIAETEAEPLAPGTEFRLARFAELIAAAVSNATVAAASGLVILAASVFNYKIDSSLPSLVSTVLIGTGIRLLPVHDIPLPRAPPCG
jgi:hypothetical protein